MQKSINWTEVRQTLEEGCALVTFNKADGSERTMECTLAEYLLPETRNESTHTKGETMIVYDL